MQTSKLVVTYLKSTTALDVDCALADILILPFRAPSVCHHLKPGDRPLVFDRTYLERSGAVALHLTQQLSQERSKAKRLDDAIRIEKAYSGLPRPWNRHRHLSSAP